MSCKTSNAEFITESDHKIVVAKLGTGISQRIKALAKEKRLKGKKQILKLDQAKDEDWEKYRTKLDREIIKVLEITDNINKIERKCSNKDINMIIC